MSRIRRSLPRVLLESFFIVLSIVIALAVDEWRDHRARGARAAEARALFVNEIESNDALLRREDFLPYHKRLQAEYKQLAADGSLEPGSLFERGIHPVPLREAAWSSFSAGATLVDFAPAEVLLLSDIYRAQEDLERLNANFIAQVTAPRSDRETAEYKRDQARAISMFLNDVVPAEERLLKAYEHALQRLKSPAAK